MLQQIWSQIFKLKELGMWLNIGLILSKISKLKYLSNQKWFGQKLDKKINFEKWTPSQPSAHICACLIVNLTENLKLNFL